MGDHGERKELGIRTEVLSPLPSALVSCRGLTPPYDKDNLIAIARTAQLTTDPPTVCISVKDERFSYHQIKQSGEFVINMVDSSLCFFYDWCGVSSGADHDKFEHCGLTPTPIKNLRTAPAVLEAPLSIGCRLVETVEMAHYAIFIGEVVSIEGSTAYLNENGKIDKEKCNFVYYSTIDKGYYDRGRKLGYYGYSLKNPLT
ncbi:flavin reductase family protein [Treponema primitia]|uniref:flavin reductase family protein n=1 Tax=Treponema primitia TaxID=88058 RepID=UPI003981413E